MIKQPLFVVFAALAFNITIFATLLQMDWLIFRSEWIKLSTWTAAVGAWHLTYAFRNR